MDGRDEKIREVVEHLRHGRIDAAEKICRALLSESPDDPETLNMLGVVISERGANARAASFFRKACESSPSNPEYLANLALSEFRQGNFEAAGKLFEKLEKMRPPAPSTLNVMGVVYDKTGEFDKAVNAFGRAILMKNDYPEAFFNLGNLMADHGRFHDAVMCFEKAVETRSGYWKALVSMGAALQRLGDLKKAEESYLRALDAKGDSHEALLGLGDVLRVTGRLPEALDAYQRAVGIHAVSPAAYCGLADCLRRLGRPGDALRTLRYAAGLAPDRAETRLMMADMLLEERNWAEGWAEFEWRLKNSDFFNAYFQGARRWDGSPSPDATLLVVDEDESCDTLLFLRHLRPLRKMFKKVVLLCRDPVVRLARASDAADEVFSANSTPVGDIAFDLYIPLLSAPGAAGLDFESPAAAAPYIRPPEEDSAAWRERLRGETRKKIGLCWSAGGAGREDARRSIPFESLRPMLEMGGLAFVRLQGDGGESHPNLQDLGVEPDDLASMAGLVANLDLVISADAAAAHLAGAMGAPVWAALPKTPGWRWPKSSGSSPVYPSARVFMQPEAGDWESVVVNISAALQSGGF